MRYFLAVLLIIAFPGVLLTNSSSVEEELRFLKNTPDFVTESLIPDHIFDCSDVRVVVTAYNSLESQCDDTPFITATGDSTKWGGIAVSRPLLKRWPYGSIVMIEGYNHPFVVFDTMNKRFREPRVDIWHESYDWAISQGVQRNIRAVKIGQIPKNQIKYFEPSAYNTKNVELCYNDRRLERMYIIL